MYEAERMMNGKTLNDADEDEDEYETYMDIDIEEMKAAVANVDTVGQLQISQSQLLDVCDLDLSIVFKFVQTYRSTSPLAYG